MQTRFVSRFQNMSIAASIAVSCFSCNAALGEVIYGSQIVFMSAPPPATQYFAKIFQTTGGDSTSIFFDYTGTTLNETIVTVDEESDWYLASAGDVFTASTIAANQFPIIFTLDNPRPPVTIPLGDFYLGVNTGSGSTGYPIAHPNRDVFGWLELYNDGTTLTPIANAVAYNEAGIIIGTTTAVPETASLLLVAPALLLLRRRPQKAGDGIAGSTPYA